MNESRGELLQFADSYQHGNIGVFDDFQEHWRMLLATKQEKSF